MDFNTLKVVLVHDWLNGMRGGEKVLEHLSGIFPKASIFSLHGELEKISDGIKKHPIHFSWIQKIPWKTRLYRYYLPLYPYAIRSFDFSGFDLVISTSHCAAKNVTVPASIPHICYCFSPMRYLWTLQDEYFGKNKLTKALLYFPQKWLKHWDLQGAKRVTRFLTISKTIQERIHQCYGLESELIYPPTSLPFMPQGALEFKQDYFLVVSALVPYKRIDLAIQASNQKKFTLKIAGTGPSLASLKKISGPQVEFLGWVSETRKMDLLKNAKALIFPGFEDFGIVPLEALSVATPVVGFGRGGLTETVTHLHTGIFFQEQTVASLIQAIEILEQKKFPNENFKETWERFTPEKFRSAFQKAVEEILSA
jgi:glycosyltransferase involved in cell wall biosynthesis